MFVDSHAHLTGGDFDQDIDAVLERAKQASLSHIINICTSIEELQKGVILAEKYPWIFNVGSTTPHDVDKVDESIFKKFAYFAKLGKLVAIGETGLDYYYEHSPKEKQKELLEKYATLAQDLNLPLVIHCREAFTDFFDIFSGYVGKVLLHCFTGTQSEAEEALSRGYYISLSGIVTFKKSKELQETAKIVPLDRLLIETDAPYLAPQGQRGKRNEPAFVAETGAFLASLKGVSLEDLAHATSKNSKQLFKIELN